MTRFLTLLIVFYLVYYLIKKFFSFFIHYSVSTANGRQREAPISADPLHKKQNSQSTPYSLIEDAQFVELDETGRELKVSDRVK